ncbi:MAG: TMEM175 family protein [Hyphomonadaceae bacterium]|nr:TMEM175 family protein [Hyphomonadaceae bacterium]
MIRSAVKSHLDQDPHFKWRGDSVTRIENLSDIVFALALGMLVSSSSPPSTYSDLSDFLFSIIPVTAGFALLLTIWNSHFTFFRRYNLADTWIVILNSALLFVVLYLAYPLRFAFDSFFAFILLVFGDSSRVQAMEVGYYEAGYIMGYFGAGYAAVSLLLALMFAHALRRKSLLDLSSEEQVLTRRAVALSAAIAALALVLAGLAAFTLINGFAGWLMILIWPVAWLVNRCYPLPKSEIDGGSAPADAARDEP